MTVIKTGVSAFDCPSDPGKDNIEEPTSAYPRAKADYMVNWGNSHYYQDTKLGGMPNPWTGVTTLGAMAPVTYLPAPFTANRANGIQNFTDGTSNTLLLSEVIIGENQGTSSDHRGDIYNDDYNCTMFMTYTPPNSQIKDQLGSGWCLYPNALNPPCNTSTPVFNAARSFHSGGVNAVLGDGHVQFVKNSINVLTWRSLGSMAGGEVISADSF